MMQVHTACIACVAPHALANPKPPELEHSRAIASMLAHSHQLQVFGREPTLTSPALVYRHVGCARTMSPMANEVSSFVLRASPSHAVWFVQIDGPVCKNSFYENLTPETAVAVLKECSPAAFLPVRAHTRSPGFLNAFGRIHVGRCTPPGNSPVF